MDDLCSNCGHELGVGRFCTNCGHAAWRTPPTDRAVRRLAHRHAARRRRARPARRPPRCLRRRRSADARHPRPPRGRCRRSRGSRSSPTSWPRHRRSRRGLRPSLRRAADRPTPAHHRRRRPWATWVAVAVVLVLVAGLGIWLLTGRRRRRPPTPTPGRQRTAQPGDDTLRPTTAGRPDRATSPRSRRWRSRRPHRPTRTSTATRCEYVGANMLDGVAGDLLADARRRLRRGDHDHPARETTAAQRRSDQRLRQDRAGRAGTRARLVPRQPAGAARRVGLRRRHHGRPRTSRTPTAVQSIDVDVTTTHDHAAPGVGLRPGHRPGRAATTPRSATSPSSARSTDTPPTARAGHEGDLMDTGARPGRPETAAERPSPTVRRRRSGGP